MRLIILLVPVLFTACDRSVDPVNLPAQFTYPSHDDSTSICSEKAQVDGNRNEIIKTQKGLKYIVRTPVNYDARYAHSLLVVYAPAGHGPRASEKFVRLTRQATENGYIIVYVGSRRMTLETIAAFGDIPEIIANDWCIDQNKIFLTGHSDGGTISTALAVMPEILGQFTAIAPSAAGFRGEDLSQYPCPEPLSVMVMHNKNDELFPGYGKQAYEWWSACNRCTVESIQQENGCWLRQGCAPGGKTLYCESQGSHREWPDRNSEMLDFFKNDSVQ